MSCNVSHSACYMYGPVTCYHICHMSFIMLSHSGLCIVGVSQYPLHVVAHIACNICPRCFPSHGLLILFILRGYNKCLVLLHPMCGDMNCITRILCVWFYYIPCLVIWTVSYTYRVSGFITSHVWWYELYHTHIVCLILLHPMCGDMNCITRISCFCYKQIFRSSAMLYALKCRNKKDTLLI